MYSDPMPCRMIKPTVCYRYLRDEDDGVSEAIIDFAVQYVGVLKVFTVVCDMCSL